MQGFGLPPAAASVVACLLLATASTAARSPLPPAIGEPPRPTSEAALREELLRLAEAHLAPLGLHLDVDRARLVLSRPLRAGEALEAAPAWPAGARPPVGPLTFELRPAEGGPAWRATLAAPLLADAWTAGRRVERGERLDCEDLRPVRRPLATLPADALGRPCALPADAVVLRRLGAQDVLRHRDLGVLPDVLAERELQLVVHSGRVAVQARAVALADGRLGETVPVRLPGRPAVLHARVMATGVATLGEDDR